MELAPVEYLLISFPGNQFNGDIAPAIADLVAKGTVHIVDLVFVKKDADGDVTVFEFEELDEAAGFIDIDGEAEAEGLLSPEDIEAEAEGLLSPEDIEAAAEALEPDSSALFIVWEDLWAADLATAICASASPRRTGMPSVVRTSTRRSRSRSVRSSRPRRVATSSGRGGDSSRSDPRRTREILGQYPP